MAKFNELRKVLTDINVNMTIRRKLLEACESKTYHGEQLEQMLLQILRFHCIDSLFASK